MRKFICLSLFFILLSMNCSLLADQREKWPIQLQFQWLNSSRISLGYHFTKRFYLGGMYIAPTDDRPTVTSRYDQEGIDSFGSIDRSGVQQAVELRWSPWNMGFYIAFGSIYMNGITRETTFTKQERLIGENTYNTGLDVKVEKEPVAGVGIGAGWNHVTKHGLSIGIGMLSIQQKPKMEITITQQNGDSTISDTDLETFEEKIKQEEDQPPSIFHISLGVNF